MQDRLTIDRPTALGVALAEAVRGVCARALTVSPADLSLLNARLACGDFEGVLARLRNAVPNAALPLFVARYVRWTGDLHTAAALWNDVMTALNPILAEPPAPALRRATAVEVATLATDLAHPQVAARLHHIARTSGPDALPLTDDQDVMLVGETADRTLGLDPDAARGRLRLRPRLDRHGELHVRGIRFGDASVSLRADRDQGPLTVRLEQDAGGLPITVLLEPFMTAFRSATVDGHPADLAAQPADDGFIVPVQLVLDDVRTVVLRETDGAGAGAA